MRFLLTAGAALAAPSLIAHTGDWRSATAQADQLIAKSRRLGGDVHAHEARELLTPWWDLKNPPLKIRLQRAALLQRDHHFEAALKDLNAALEIDPKLTQAWLMKTTILTVMGRYEEARRSSIPLFGLASPVIAATAGSAPTSSNGSLQASYTFLSNIISQHQESAPAIKAWAQTALAEMSVRLGKVTQADKHFRAALMIDQSSPYLLTSYAYFLIEQRQHQRVLLLLEKARAEIPLPWLLAEKEVNGVTSDFKEVLQQFESKNKRKQLAHGHSHGREEAIFHLVLKKDAREALHQAEGNWKSQREAADLLILMKSAIAAEDEVTLASTLDWIKEKSFEDVRLQPLIEEARQIISG